MDPTLDFVCHSYNARRSGCHTLFRSLLAAVILLIGTAATPVVAQQPAAKTLLTDFSNDLSGSDDDSTVSLRFLAIRDLPNGRSGDVVIQLLRRDGQWASRGHVVAADYNQRSKNQLTIKDLQLKDGHLTGEIGVQINPDRPRPGGVSPSLGPQPFPPIDAGPDQYTIKVDAQLTGGAAPFIADTEKHEPPWRKDTPLFGGKHLAGQFEATRNGGVTKGKIVGAVSPSGMRNTWTTQGNIFLEPAPGGGASVLARLSPERVMSFGSAGATKWFGKAQDWSAYSHLLITIDSNERRDDVSVYLQATSTSGASGTVSSAAPLLGREHTYKVPLHRLNGNLRSIRSIGFGVTNRTGVGDVAFAVRRIELARLAESAPAPRQAGPIVITVEPSIIRVHNGVDTVPKGLFGMHVVDWARRANPLTLAFHRQINAGLLRPISHVGFNSVRYTPDQILQDRTRRLLRGEPRDSTYQLIKASDAVDEVVWCHTQDLFSRPKWMDDGIEPWEQRIGDFYHNLAARAWTPGDQYNYMRRFEVWNEPFFWARHINMGHRLPAGKKDWVDPTQYGYVPGQLGADMYSRLFKAAARSGKAANRHALFGGPSAPPFSQNGYGTFENYVRRFIDQCIDDIDFLTEHHYGGNPASYAASYEAVTAYTDITHGRRIPVYNTEANLLGGSSAGKAAYNTEDILSGIIHNPDIYRGRALHALWAGRLIDQGELHTYTALNALRGRMLVCRSSGPDVLTVAALNGAGEIVVVAYNKAWGPRQLQLNVLGQGAKVTDALMLLAKAPPKESDLRDPEGQPIPAPPSSKTSLVKLDPGDVKELSIPARSLVRWTLRPSGRVGSNKQVTEQSFVDAVFQQVAPGKPVEAEVVWRGGIKPRNADAAALRVLTADVHDGEAVLEIGDQVLDLPYSDGNAERNVLQTIPLDPDWLEGDVKMTFRVSDPKTQNGYRVLSASILLTVED